MSFMATFRCKPDTESRDKAIARFKKTGGFPPDGVKLLGRWTSADFSGGFDLLESDDVTAIAEFAYIWSDLLDCRIVPVINDAELKDVLKCVRS